MAIKQGRFVLWIQKKDIITVGQKLSKDKKIIYPFLIIIYCKQSANSTMPKDYLIDCCL